MPRDRWAELKKEPSPLPEKSKTNYDPLEKSGGFLFSADVGNMVGNENLHGTRGQEISPNNLLLLLASPRGVEPRLQA
jgi:hypothetical protein